MTQPKLTYRLIVHHNHPTIRIWPRATFWSTRGWFVRSPTLVFLLTSRPVRRWTSNSTQVRWSLPRPAPAQTRWAASRTRLAAVWPAQATNSSSCANFSWPLNRWFSSDSRASNRNWLPTVSLFSCSTQSRILEYLFAGRLSRRSPSEGSPQPQTSGRSALSAGRLWAAAKDLTGTGATRTWSRLSSKATDCLSQRWVFNRY